jgi:hypothetical protein
MAGGFVPARSMAAERTQRGGSRQEIEADGLCRQADTCHVLRADALFEQATAKYEAEFRADRQAWSACIKAGWAKRRAEGTRCGEGVEALQRRMATFKSTPATLAGAYCGLYWNREEPAHLTFRRSLQQVLDEAPLQQLSFAELMQTLEAPGWNKERLVVRAAKYGAASEFSHLLRWLPNVHPQATAAQLAHRNDRCAVWFEEAIVALLKQAYTRLAQAGPQEVETIADKLAQLLTVTPMPQGDLFYGVWVELALRQRTVSLLKHLGAQAFAPQTLYCRSGRYPPAGSKFPPTPQQGQSTQSADRTFAQLLLGDNAQYIESKLAYIAHHGASFVARQQQTPSCMAQALRHRWSVLETLLDNGLGINARDPWTGHTVLFEAVANKRADCLVALLERGADPIAAVGGAAGNSAAASSSCALSLAQGHGYERERRIIETYMELQPVRAQISSWARRCGTPAQSVYAMLCPAGFTAPEVHRAISKCITLGDSSRLMSGERGVELLEDVLKWFRRAPSAAVLSAMERLVFGLPDVLLVKSLAGTALMPKAERWPLFLRIIESIPFYDCSREHDYRASADLLKDLIQDLSGGRTSPLRLTQTQFCSLPLTYFTLRARTEMWRRLRYLNNLECVEQAHILCQAVCFYDQKKRTGVNFNALIDCDAVAKQRINNRREQESKLTGAHLAEENTALANLAAKGLTSFKKMAKTVIQKTSEIRGVDEVTAVDWSAFKEDCTYAYCYESLDPLPADTDEGVPHQAAQAPPSRTVAESPAAPQALPPTQCGAAASFFLAGTQTRQGGAVDTSAAINLGTAADARPTHSGAVNSGTAAGPRPTQPGAVSSTAAAETAATQPGAVDAAANDEILLTQERLALAALREPLAALAQKGSRLEHDDLRSLFAAVRAAGNSLPAWARLGACVSRTAASFTEADQQTLDALHSALSDDATVEIILGTQALGHSRKERMGMRRDVARAYASLCCLVMGPERLQQLSQAAEAQSELRGLQRTWHPDKHRSEPDPCVQQTYAKVFALINVIKLRLGQNEQFFALLPQGATPTGDLKAFGRSF